MPFLASDSELYPRIMPPRLHPREAQYGLHCVWLLLYCPASHSPLTEAQQLMLPIYLVSALISHCPKQGLPSFLLYYFGKFLVTHVTASVNTNMSAWAVQMIPISLKHSFLFGVPITSYIVLYRPLKLFLSQKHCCFLFACLFVFCRTRWFSGYIQCFRTEIFMSFSVNL